MIRGGFYLKARCIDRSAIAHAPPHVREIWDWVIRKANYGDREHLRRGQLLANYDDIRDGLSWYVGYRKMRYSKWDCEKAIKWLTREGMINVDKTTRGLIITICNYDYYQDSGNYEITNVIKDLRSHYESHNEDHTEDHNESHNESHTVTDAEQGLSTVHEDKSDAKTTTRATTKTTTRATTKNKSPATIQKKVLKKEKEIYVPFFQEFWGNYPARNGKKLEKEITFELFCNLKPCEALLCVHAAKHYADSKMIREGIGIKDPKRFLISGRGQDKTQFWREWVEPEAQKSPDIRPPDTKEPPGPSPPQHWYYGGDGKLREYGTNREITQAEMAARKALNTTKTANPVLTLVREMTA